MSGFKDIISNDKIHPKFQTGKKPGFIKPQVCLWMDILFASALITIPNHPILISYGMQIYFTHISYVVKYSAILFPSFVTE